MLRNLCCSRLAGHLERTFVQRLCRAVLHHASQQLLQRLDGSLRRYLLVYHDSVEHLHHLIAATNLLHKLRLHHTAIVSDGVVICQQRNRCHSELVTY